MAGAGDRQKLGDALDQGEQDQVPESHRAQGPKSCNGAKDCFILGIAHIGNGCLLILPSVVRTALREVGKIGK
jgi:hypothetical protein